ncbi:autotransporter outer membrane beta-barrel domain-containing protein [Serratia microhaemolytica]|uniref:autotransporter outer membrane beta-barrel domain-containing protein n=1 Tax=Serratia microhaemolytica TaxID=2675110 RepID=UPI000FDD6930|nr:autotransporter outer membrane beta-barrel domain-containing protein [Serratia microhaemolytica]
MSKRNNQVLNRNRIKFNLLLSGVILTGLTGFAQAELCEAGTVTPASYHCFSELDQSIELSGEALDVTTGAGFGVFADSGNGLTLTGDKGVRFFDDNESLIFSNDYGAFIKNHGGGVLSITSNGAILGGMGAIYAHNSEQGTDLTIDVSKVAGDENAISAENHGTGALTISSSKYISAITGQGIIALNRGTDLSIDITVLDAENTAIQARNLGSGDLTINVSDRLASYAGVGVMAYNAGRDLLANLADAYAESTALLLINNGSGSLTLTASGELLSTHEEAVLVDNSGTDVTVQVNRAIGQSSGIDTNNQGTGATVITSSGLVEGKEMYGIHAKQHSAGTDVTIQVVDVKSKEQGILAENQGSGALSITSSGNVTSLTGKAIEARNAGTDLTINAANVTGDISAVNTGSGVLSITTIGEVTSAEVAIIAVNSGSDLRLQTENVYSEGFGILAFNEGSGVLSISSSGLVNAEGENGIYAKNSGTDITLQLNDVFARGDAIDSENNGTGSTTIMTSGLIVSAEGVAIRAVNGDSAADLTIQSTGSVFGLRDGIAAENNGSGELAIRNNQSISSLAGRGIYARNEGGKLSIDVKDVDAATDAILAQNNGTGELNLVTNGKLTAGVGYGINAQHNGDGSVIVTVNKGSEVEGGAGAINITSDQDILIENHGFISHKSGRSSATAINTTGSVSLTVNEGLLVGGVTLKAQRNGLINGESGVWYNAGSNNTFGLSADDKNTVMNSGIIMAAMFNSAANASAVKTTFNLAKLYNEGVLSMGNGVAGDVTVINGNYHGDQGLIEFDTVLGADDSLTDKLVINGDSSGTSFVSVSNLGGRGAYTLNGIELITVRGKSEGEFVQANRIAAGAYDYSLVRGAGALANNWYLSSLLKDYLARQQLDKVFSSLSEAERQALAAADADQANAPRPDDSSDETVTALQEKVAQLRERVRQQYAADAASPQLQRPEAAAYASNLAVANTLLNSRLQDRLGETRYLDQRSGATRHNSMWLRTEGGHNRSRDESGQLHTQANRYLVQLGGNIMQWEQQGVGQVNLGLMAGYANSNSSSNSTLTNYRADGKVDGYGVGVYVTWYAPAADQSGWYLDSWAQYNRFDNSVSGDGLTEENYKSKGVTAAIEGGYSVKLAENSAQSVAWFIQPQAQFTWQAVKADSHVETNGTRVSAEGDGNLQTRLGVKTFLNGYSVRDKDNTRAFQPFVEANWLHNSKSFASVMDGVSLAQDGASNIAEVKLGVNGQVNRQWELSGHITQQMGSAGYSDTAAQLAVKFHF